MSVCCWLFLSKLFAATAIPHNIILSKPQIKDRKVNLELETVLEFNNKDNAADIHFLNNIQDFIGNVKQVIHKNHDLRRDFSRGKLETFTDFIHNIIEVIYKFEDDDLEYFFSVISEEIRKYHYRGCKFHELAENYGLRKFVTNGLDTLKNIPARSIRQKLLAVAEKIEEDNYDNNEKDLVNFVNSLYKQNAVEKFRKILTSFDDYRLNARHGNVSLVKIIREGIRSIIFDHYTELNHNARNALKSKMEEYFKYLTDLSNTLDSQLNAEEIQLRSYNEDQNIKTVKDSKQHKLKVYMSETAKNIEHKTDITVTANTNIYIDLNKYMPETYETPFYEYTTKGKTEFKKMTFMTLYPKFVGYPTEFHAQIISPKFSINKNKLILQENRDDEFQIDRRPRVYESVTEADFDTRRRRQTTTKNHKAVRTMRQIYVERNIARKSNLFMNDKFKTTKRKSKLTFMTLYPEFDKDTITRQYLRANKPFTSAPIENTMQTLWYEEMQKPYHNDLQGRNPKAMLSTDKSVLEVATMKPYATKKVVPTKRLKYKVKLRAHDIQRNTSALTTKKPKLVIVTFRTKYSDLKNMSRQSFAELVQPARDISNMESKMEVPTISDTTFAAHLKDNNFRRSYSNSLPNVRKDDVLVDKRILTRLQELEKELKVVKKRILNDTETIMELNRKVHNKANDRNNLKRTNQYNPKEHNPERNTKPMEEVVFNLAAQINLNDGRWSKKFDSASTKKVSSNLIEWKKYLRNLQNTQLKSNKRYTTINYEDNLLHEDKVNNNKLSKKYLKQNYESSMINKKNSFTDDKYGNKFKNDHDNYKKGFKQIFDLKSFSGEKNNIYSNKKSANVYDFDTKSVNTNLYQNKFHGKLNNEDFSIISQIKTKEREYVTSTTHRLDDIEINNNQYKTYENYINSNAKGIKHRFELKSNSDNKVNSYSNKMNAKKVDFGRIAFDRDNNPHREKVNYFESNANNIIKEREQYSKNSIRRPESSNGHQNKHIVNSYTNPNQKYVQHRFQLSSFGEDKNNSHPNEIHERKPDFNKTVLSNNKRHENDVKNENDNKRNQNSLTFIDVNEYRKQQESKYYPSSKKYDLYEDKENTNRQRIYETDPNKDKYKDNNNNHLVRNAQVATDIKINKLSEDRGTEIKSISKHDNYLTHMNTQSSKLYYESTGGYKMHTIDTKYGSDDKQFIKAKEFNSGVTTNIIQKDLGSDGKLVVKSTDQKLHIDNISPLTEKYISPTANNASQTNEQFSKFNNEGQDNDLDKHRIHEGVDRVQDYKKENNIEYDLNKGIDKEESKIRTENSTQGIIKSDFNENNLLVETNHKKNDVEFKSDIKKDVVNEFIEQKYYSTSKNPLITVSLHDFTPTLVNNYNNKYDVDRVQDIRNNLDDKKVKYDLDKGSHKEELLLKGINSTNGQFKYDNENKMRSDVSHEKSDVVFKSDSKKDELTRNMEHTYYTKHKNNELSLRGPDLKPDGNAIGKNRLNEATEGVYDYKKGNKVKNDFFKNGFKTEPIATENDEKIKHDYNGNKSTDTNHKKNDFVFKSDPDKDVLNQYMEHNYNDPNNEINNLGGGSLNQHSQTTSQVRQFADDKLNKSFNSNTLPKDAYKNAHGAQEGNNIKEKEKSTTDTLNVRKDKNMLNPQKKTTPVNTAVVKKDTLSDLRILKQNNNNTNKENGRLNRTSIVTTSTTKRIMNKTETTTASVSPSAIRRIFTDVRRSSITPVTTVASLPVLSSRIPGQRVDDYSIPPRLNEYGYAGLDPYDVNVNLGYGGYGDMRRSNDQAALELYQQYAGSNINSTSSPGDAAGNKARYSDRNLYDYENYLRNMSLIQDRPFVPSPGFIRPPAFDDPILL